jgi:hypothetical protein
MMGYANSSPSLEEGVGGGYVPHGSLPISRSRRVIQQETA